MTVLEIEAQVRAILGPGPWQTVSDFTIQGYALWEAQGKSRDKPWALAERRTTAQQCTVCGASSGAWPGLTSTERGCGATIRRTLALAERLTECGRGHGLNFVTRMGFGGLYDPHPLLPCRGPLARCPQVPFNAGVK
jgi:hypothetical protein